MLTNLDARANKRVKGSAWDKIRPQLEAVHSALTIVSPTVSGQLTTIYIKYTSAETGAQPFAVLWIKKSTELVLGLALPVDHNKQAPHFVTTNLKYSGLTAYLRFTPADDVPSYLADLVQAAYRNLLPGGI